MLKFIQLVRHVGPWSLVRKTAMEFCYCWLTNRRPIPVAEPSIAWVYGRPLAGNAVSNPVCLSGVTVGCCRVEDYSLGWSPVQRSPTDCGVSGYDREVSIMRKLWPTRRHGGRGGGLIICRPVQQRSLYALGQACTISCVVGVTSEGFSLHEGDLKFNSSNEKLISEGVFNCTYKFTCVFVHTSCAINT